MDGREVPSRTDKQGVYKLLPEEFFNQRNIYKFLTVEILER